MSEYEWHPWRIYFDRTWRTTTAPPFMKAYITYVLVRVHIHVRLKDERLLSKISSMMSGPWILYLVCVKGVSFFFCLHSNVHTLHLRQCYTIVTKLFSSSHVPNRSPCMQTEVKINLLSHPYHVRCLWELNRSRIVQNTRMTRFQGLFSPIIPTFSCSLETGSGYYGNSLKTAHKLINPPERGRNIFS